MRVLLLSNLYPSPEEPTRGTFNRQVFGALAKFCDVRVVSPRPWWSRVRTPRDLFNVPEDRSTGLKVTYPAYWAVPRVGQRLHGRALYYSLRRHVAAIRRAFPFDIILAAWAYPDAYAAAWLARDVGCPLVTNLMGSDINDLAFRSGLRPQICWCLNQSEHIVAVSAALRDRVVELGISSDKIRVQHNGVDGALFTIKDRQEVRTRLGLPLDRNLVLYIGNLRRVKGTDVLIEAMGRLAQTTSDTNLVIAGSGEMEEGLRFRVRELGIADRVHFVGRKIHDQVPDWISACDIFCLPSRNEGCPNVILEALASGRPVVASRVGGVPEILTEGNGILLPAENPAALAQALLDALQRSWSPKSLRASVENLSWETVGEKYYQTLVDAVGDTSRTVREEGHRRRLLV